MLSLSSAFVRRASLVFIFLPLVIFSVFWLRAAATVGVLFTSCLGLYLIESYFVRTQSDRRISISIKHVIFISIMALAWSLLGGFWGIGRHASDWDKHYSVFRDLVFNPWPVIYQGSDTAPRGSYLVYYTAFYLPAALIGKLLGWTAAHLFLGLWATIGMMLVFLWIHFIIPTRGLICCMIFPLMSGMDVLGSIILRGVVWYSADEWWGNPSGEPWLWQYSSNATLIDWVPQHALAGWICTGMLMGLRLNTSLTSGVWLAVACLSFLWSPFVSLGLFFLLGFYSITTWNFRWLRTGVFFIPIFFAGICYLKMVRSEKIPSELIFGLMDGPAHWLSLVWFIIIEFGFFSFVCWKLLAAEESKKWLWGAVTLLCVLPFIHVGDYSDLMLRGSIPGLFILWISSLTCIVKDDPFNIKNRWWYVALIAGVCIGSLTPFMEYHLGFRQIGQGFTRANEIILLPELSARCRRQYLGPIKNGGLYVDWLSPTTQPPINCALVPSRSMVGHWDFVDQSNPYTDTVRHIRGTASNGALPSIADEEHHAIELHASDLGTITLGSPVDFDFGESKDFTVSLWIKTNGWLGDAPIITNKGWRDGSRRGWAIAGGNSGRNLWCNLSFADGARYDVKNEKTIVNDDKWHHLCLTLARGAPAHFFIDGRLAYLFPTEQEIGSMNTGLPIVIGNDGTMNYPYYFNGSIADVRIFNYALSEQEVRDHLFSRPNN